jgi:hypothetical protein
MKTEVIARITDINPRMALKSVLKESPCFAGDDVIEFESFKEVQL